MPTPGISSSCRCDGPNGRTCRMTIRRRFAHGALRSSARSPRPRSCSRRSSARPRSISRRAFDFSIPFADNVDAQIFFVARLPRTLAGALVGARSPRPASSSRGCCATRWRRRSRSASRPAPRSARCSRSRSTGRSASPGSRRCPPPASPARWRGRHRLRAGPGAAPRPVDDVLLLAGVTMNAFFSALILFVQYFADFADTYRTLRWLMGDLDVSSYQPLLAALPLLLVAFAVFAWLARPLNLLSARRRQRRDARPRRDAAQRAAFFSASLATGAAVSVGGPIGFVGIIVPHLVRLLVGSGSSPRAAGVGALRRGVPRRLRRRRAHDPRAGRTAGRHHHGAHRRTVLPVAAGEETMIRSAAERVPVATARLSSRRSQPPSP